MQQLQGKVSLLLVDHGEESYACLRIVDGSSRTHILEAKIPLLKLGQLILMNREIDGIDLDMYIEGSDRWGLVLETKQVEVTLPRDHFMCDNKLDEVLEKLKIHEVDGWSCCCDVVKHLSNHHNWGRVKDGQMTVKFPFHRFV